MRALIGLGPVAVTVGVGKTTLDYLPQPLTGDGARYLLAAMIAIASGTTVALIAVAARRRMSRAEAAGVKRQTGESLAETTAVLRK